MLFVLRRSVWKCMWVFRMGSVIARTGRWLQLSALISNRWLDFLSDFDDEPRLHNRRNIMCCVPCFWACTGPFRWPRTLDTVWSSCEHSSLAGTNSLDCDETWRNKKGEKTTHEGLFIYIHHSSALSRIPKTIGKMWGREEIIVKCHKHVVNRFGCRITKKINQHKSVIYTSPTASKTVECINTNNYLWSNFSKGERWLSNSHSVIIGKYSKSCNRKNGCRFQRRE